MSDGPDPERVANGINHVISTLPPEWRRVAYDLIAEMPHRTTSEILAAILTLVAIEARREAEQADAAEADNDRAPGREEEAGPGTPAPPPPVPRQHPTCLPPTTTTNTLSNHDDEHVE
ncbi:hypothetical protein [Nonomuraea jabiensis]|uniref:Uncharacterized protein n=1 Tax=Nonomuraea jabiensis TaxID=882448 RepID=A0A7W9G2Y5_9ACTN|nr:hypothetical protein [Nonomuraea jabiensis]MBB5776228.1 hypothetical protein [Nonomuraea jabiensis]